MTFPLLGDVNPVLFWSVIGFSSATFIAGLVVVPWLILRIPSDYFVCSRPPRLRFERQHPVLRAVLLTVKNLLGAAVATAGAVMLVTPGPGMFGILAGIWLMDFPGKRALERWLISRPVVLKALNRLRRRYGRAPLESPRINLPCPRDDDQPGSRVVSSSASSAA